MQAMNSRERFLAAAAHKPTDRVPVDYCTRNDVAQNLMDLLGCGSTEALYQKLGIDSRRFAVKEHNPEFTARVNGTLGGRSQRSGAEYIFYEDGTYEDSWGIVHRPSADGKYDEWVSGPFMDNDDLSSFPWPGFDILESVESMKARLEPLAGKYALIATLNYPFKVCWQMRGLENYLCDMLIDEDFAVELMEKAAGYELEKALRAARAGADIVSFSGDIAMQDTMMVSVGAWRKLDKPIFARMIKEIKAERPDILIYYHSDGNMEEVIPDMIEIGVDILNPIQPESMDVGEIYRKYADRVCLHGTISIQETLPHGTLDDVRAEVRHRMSLCREKGGLIISPANHVQNDTPLENIVEIYKAAGSFVE